ncbi:Fucose 4-O-acetylase [Rhizobiales bacterium GAS113]|nr:Fucose 4-O-acetylase [Rhizobiales bacterium GAS113]
MPASEQPTQAAPASRLAFVDNLRWSMIVLVISMHAADTYSPFGNWYYGDKTGTDRLTALLFGTYQSFLQAFFMALLFAVSGYFAAASIRRKGAVTFMIDRSLRLGLPVLLYMLVIGPVTQYYIAGSWRPTAPTSFGREWLHHILDGEVFSESGPLWFCVALLLFSIAYAGIWSLGDKIVARPPGEPLSTSPPSTSVILAFIGVMTVATFAVRLFVPNGDAVLNMQLGDFPSYLLMFAVGIHAQYRQWLFRLPSATGRNWAIAGIVLGLIGWVLIIWLGGALQGQFDGYRGGWHWPGFSKDLWESFVCVAISLGLIVLYRDHFNRQGQVSRFLSDNAFAVYVFHPPILILVTRLLHFLPAPSAFKFIVATLGGAALTLLFSALVARRTPLLRTVL